MFSVAACQQYFPSSNPPRGLPGEMLHSCSEWQQFCYDGDLAADCCNSCIPPTRFNPRQMSGVRHVTLLCSAMCAGVAVTATWLCMRLPTPGDVAQLVHVVHRSAMVKLWNEITTCDHILKEFV